MKQSWLASLVALGYLVFAVNAEARSLGGPLTLADEGAFFVNGAKSWFTVAFPEFWLYFLGLLFVVVTLFLPDGIVGGVKKLFNKQAEVKA